MNARVQIQEKMHYLLEADDNFKRNVLRSNAFVNIVLGILFIIISHNTYSIWQKIFLYVFLASNIGMFFYSKKKYHTMLQILMALSNYMMFLFILIYGDIYGVRIFWICIIPVYTILSSNMVIGLWLNLAIFVSMLLCLLTPLNQYVYGCSYMLRAQFPIVYLGMFILAVTFEFFRSSTQKAFERANENLHTVATKDSLTGISNLFDFMEKAEYFLFDKIENQYAMISLRLKGGTMLNDLYGCEYFNEILKQIAHTLDDLVDKDEIVARDNSSLFVMLLRYETIEGLENRLGLIAKTLIGEVGRLSIKIAIGAVEINTPAIDLYHLYHNSLLAQNHVMIKQSYGVMFYDPSMRRKVELVSEIEDNMSQALKNGDFIIYYQPKFDIKKQMYTAAEALVRWKYVDGTIMSPFYFIPVFESNQFIISMDYYIFELVCKDIRRWMTEGKEPPIVSVNMSRLHIYDDNFTKILCDIADKYEVPKQYLEIELTESALVKEENKIKNVLSDCQDKGFSISMDDFGSGYSSLHALFNLPIKTLKLDKSLFGSIDNSKNKDVVYGIIEICKRLKIDTVAEGIETKDWVDILTEAGCDFIQGYYYAKPVPTDEFEKLIFENK